MKTKRLRATLTEGCADPDDQLWLLDVEGYGDCNSCDGKGTPVALDYAYGELRLIVWGDIKQEEPTHTISLEGAKESARRDENYTIELEALDRDHIGNITDVAGRVLNEVIKPFCDKNQLRFVAGMGIWFFERIDPVECIQSDDWDVYYTPRPKYLGDPEDPEDRDCYERYKPPEGYADIKTLITTVVYSKNQLYEYMHDYTPNIINEAEKIEEEDA